MNRIPSLVVFLATVQPALVLAQSDQTFAALARTVSPGERIAVTTATGAAISGRLLAVMDEWVEVATEAEPSPGGSGPARQRFALTDVSRVVASKKDRIWNGVAVGGASGLGGGILLWWGAGGCDCYSAGVFVKVFAGPAVVGVAIGALIDGLTQGTRSVTVFENRGAHVSVASLVDRAGAGGRVLLSF